MIVLVNGLPLPLSCTYYSERLYWEKKIGDDFCVLDVVVQRYFSARIQLALKEAIRLRVIR